MYRRLEVENARKLYEYQKYAAERICQVRARTTTISLISLSARSSPRAHQTHRHLGAASLSSPRVLDHLSPRARTTQDSKKRLLDLMDQELDERMRIAQERLSAGSDYLLKGAYARPQARLLSALCSTLRVFII